MTESKLVLINRRLQPSSFHHERLMFTVPTSHNTFRVYVSNPSIALLELLNMISLWNGSDHEIDGILGWEMREEDARFFYQLSRKYHLVGIPPNGRHE